MNSPVGDDTNPIYPSDRTAPIPVDPFAAPDRSRFASMSLEEIARTAGLRRVDVVAWRDFDDEESGGSELHAHRILSAWAAAGVSINMTTSTAPGRPPFIRRGGYQVTRRVGRYSIFPRTMISGWRGKLGRGDGLVEIWNGMPFLSPIWAQCPRVVFLHHVHGEMWKMVLPRGLAEIGETFERRVAPKFYGGSQVITLSASSKAEIVSKLGLPPSNVSVSPPGVETHFSPGSRRSESPLVVAVGRLVPVKRFDLMIEGLVALKARHPELRAVIAGEGYERPSLEALVRSHNACSWILMPGRVSDEHLIELYRSAWVVASTSLREGWGMTVTEAGACRTPAVASRISGHLDAVVDGRSGLLFDDADGLVESLDTVLGDEVLRKQLSEGAFEYSARFSWENAARGALAVLAAEALRRRGPPRSNA
jgi:glycosyltransferase involved in cell wall biosynthesis